MRIPEGVHRTCNHRKTGKKVKKGGDEGRGSAERIKIEIKRVKKQESALPLFD